MIGESFKQQCPTCEAMVLIKSAALVGKKMECPKCKDQFVVAKPAPKPPGSSAELVAVAPPAKPKPAAPAKPAPAPALSAKQVSKPAAGETYALEDDDTSTRSKSAPAVKKAAPKPAEDSNEYEEIAKPPVPARKPVGKPKALAEKEPEPPAKPAKPAAPAKKAPVPAAMEDEAEEYVEIAKPPVAAKKPPPPTKPNPVQEDDDEEEIIAEAEPDDDDEEIIAEAEPDDDEEEKEAPKKPLVKVKAKPAADEEEAAAPKPASKKGKAPVKPSADEVEAEETPKPAKKTPVKSKAKAAKEEEPSEEPAPSEEETAAKPKKKLFNFDFKKFKFNLETLKALQPKSRKTAIGAGLAVVGILVLGVAGYLMIAGGGPAPQPPTKGPPPGPAIVKVDPGKVKPPEKVKDPGKDNGKKPPPKEKKLPETVKRKILPVSPASLPELTGLLPADAEQVIRLNFENILNEKSLFHEAAFNAFGQPGPFHEKILEKKLGFAPLKIDEFIQTERFSDAPWSFTIVHVLDNLDIENLSAALNLQKVKDAELKIIKKTGKAKAPAVNVDYYRLGDNPWLEQLARLAPGVPAATRQMLSRRPGSQLYLHLRDHQTLILADKQPLLAYLQDQINKAGEKPVVADKALSFTTLKAPLRTALDHLQPKDAERDQVLFVSATLMQNAEVKTSKQPGALIQYRPRPFWDLTALMEERHARLNVMGVALIAHGKFPTQHYQYRTEFSCITVDHARDLAKELERGPVTRVKQLLEQFLKVKFEVSNTDKTKGMSHASVVQSGSSVKLVLDLSLERHGMDNPATNLGQYLGLLMTDAHAELALFEESDLLHQLARAGRKMAEDSDARWRLLPGLRGQVTVGQYPPGAFPLTIKGSGRVTDPGRRISWMAALLPYLEHQGVYDKIRFDTTWNDPSNWPAGRTLVPQFINPSYPASSRYVEHPDFPVAYGATHFVGVAGVGLDAGDPVLTTRRGILGYETSATMEEVSSGRGLSNAMLMIQVPYDSLPGFSPWIAGGGGTLRGIPETNSINPFIAKGGDGTYAIMADGSVRFITPKIGDKILQSMSTYQEAGFNIEANQNAKLVAEKK